MSKRVLLPLFLLLVALFASLPASADDKADRQLALRQAQAPLRARDWPAAAQSLRAFRETYPGTEEAQEAWVLESRALLHAGKAREALDLTSAFLETYGESAWAGRMTSNAADCYVALSREKESADVLIERVEAVTAPEARAAIGALHLALADADFEGVETKDDLGRTTKKTDFTRALRSYQHALTVGVTPDKKAYVRERIALSIEKRGSPGESVPVWTALLDDVKSGALVADSTSHERWLVGRGRSRLAAGDLDGARKDLRQALTQHPNGKLHMEILLLLGKERIVAAKRNGDDVAMEEGIAWLRRAVLEHREDERALKAQESLAEVYEFRAQAEKAAAEWGALVERFPDSDAAPVARDRQAQALARAGLFDEAIRAWERFLAAWPNHALWQQVRGRIVDAAFAKGTALLAKKDVEGAVAAWRAFSEGHPTDKRAPEALLRAGQALKDAKDIDAALALWRQIAGRYAGAPQAPVARLRIATTLEDDLHDLEAAVKAYEELVEKHPNTPPAAQASARLERLKARHLELRLERVVGTDDKPVIKVATRNVEALDVRVYRLQVEEYFRRKGTILGVENLQLEVVKPDKTATWKLEDYRPFQLVEADREVPVDGPGAYVVVAGDDHLTATALFLVSDLEIVVKKARGHHLFVWSFARDGQTPAAGARVLVAHGDKVKEVGKTGADGVWQGSPKIDASNVLVLSENGPAASGMAPGPVVATGFQSKAYVYTERPVYRPGQEVRWRAIFLRARGGGYEAPVKRDGRVSVADARGQTLFEGPTSSSAFGAFAGTFPLDGAAPLGVWKIQIQVLHEGTWTGEFEVQEYRKPEFTLELEPLRPLYLTGEKVEATARLTYAFGAPVADAEVSWEVRRVARTFEPSTAEDYGWYFKDDRRADETRRAARPRGTLVQRGNGRTDDGGEVVLAFETQDVDEDAEYVVRVGAQDVTRRWVYDEGRIPVTRRDHMAVVRTDRKVYRPRQEMKIEVRTVDAAERPVARGGDLLLLELVRHAVETPGPRRRGGAVTVRVEEVERASYPLTTGADGSAEARVRVPGPGRWRLRWRALDGRGALVTAYADVEASGEAEDPSRDARLVAARTVWTEGDEAEVLLQSPRSGVRALLTYEGERVLQHRFVDIQGSSTLLALPLTGRDAPNVFFKIAIPGAGRLLEAETEIVVLRLLQVEVDLPRTAGPGEEVEVTVRTKDARGQPVAAEVGFALIDETLYAIAPDRAPSIRPFFYDRRRQNAVQTVSSLGFAIVGTTRETNPDLLADQAARGGDLQLAMARSALRNAEEALRRGDARTATQLALRAAEAAPELFEARAFLARLREDREARKVLERLDRELLKELEQTAPMRPAASPTPRARWASKDAKAKEEMEEDLDELSDAAFEDSVSNEVIGLGGGAGGSFGGRGGRRSLRAQGGGRRAEEKSVPGLLAYLKKGDSVTAGAALGGPGLADAAFLLEARKRFEDAVAWTPHLVTGKSGEAKVKVKLPDNLTTWRAVVRGVSGQALVGEGRGRLVSRRDLVVRIDTPRFLVETDRLEVPTVVHNESGQALDVRTTQGVEGAKLQGLSVGEGSDPVKGGETTFRLPAGAAFVTDMDVEALSAGRVRFECSAVSSQGAADRTEARLLTLPRGLHKIEGRTGVVDTARGAMQQTFLELPDGTSPGATRLAIVLYPGLDAALLDALLTLEVFPYGCVEQTVHRFLPALQARAALIAAGSPAADRLRALDEAVASAATRLRNLQNSNGSFGWFRAGQGNLAMTAYALLGLAGARDAGVGDLDRSIANAAAALTRLLQAGDENVRALGHYALARVGVFDHQTYGTTFRRRRDDLDVPGLAWMAMAAQILDRSYDADELVGLLLQRRVEKDATTHWKGKKEDCFVGSDREATGLAIQALLATHRETPHVQRGLDWLLANRTKGGFGTTKETAAFVGAASAWIQKHGAQAHGGEIQILLDGKVVRTVRTGPKGLAAKDRRFLLAEAATLGAGRHTLGFRLDGQGRLHWAARLDYVLASEDLPAEEHGLTLTRTYLRPEEAGVEGQPPPVKPGYQVLRPAARPRLEARTLSSVASGDRVLVRVEVDAPRELQYVLLEDPLPAGFEVLDATTEGPFDWQERRDDRQVFFASKLPKGKTVYRYVLQATHRGRFTAHGSTASPMYLPEVHARAAGTVLRVTKAPSGEADAEHPPTPDELYAHALRLFAERDYDKAAPIFRSLLDDQPLRDEIVEEIELHMLKMAVEKDDAAGIVRAREALVRRNPGRIPGDWRTQRRIAFAYHTQGEFEAASHLYRDLVARGFGLRTDWSQTLTRRGREVEGLDALGEALKGFPVSNATADAAFRRSQRYRELPRPAGRHRPEGRPMDLETLDSLWSFTAHFAETRLAAQANYGLVGALRRAGDLEGAAVAAERFLARFPDSQYVDDAYYFLAETRFRTFEREPDAASAEAVRQAAKPLVERQFAAEGSRKEWSPYRSRAWHLLGRVEHVLGNLDQAIHYYRRARDLEDAREAYAFLTEERLDLDATLVVGLEGGAGLPVRYRNVREVSLKAYPVDLQILFAVRKRLEGLHDVDLSGIVPAYEWKQTFPDAADHLGHEGLLELPVEAGKPGAWLVVAKAGEHEAKSLVVKSDLVVVLQRIGEKVRVYVTDGHGRNVRGAYVTVSDGERIRARGVTDGRGVFEAPGVGSKAAVVVSKDDGYAIGR